MPQALQPDSAWLTSENAERAELGVSRSVRQVRSQSRDLLPVPLSVHTALSTSLLVITDSSQHGQLSRQPAPLVTGRRQRTAPNHRGASFPSPDWAAIGLIPIPGQEESPVPSCSLSS